MEGSEAVTGADVSVDATLNEKLRHLRVLEAKAALQGIVSAALGGVDVGAKVEQHFAKGGVVDDGRDEERRAVRVKVSSVARAEIGVGALLEEELDDRHVEAAGRSVAIVDKILRETDRHQKGGEAVGAVGVDG